MPITIFVSAWGVWERHGAAEHVACRWHSGSGPVALEWSCTRIPVTTHRQESMTSIQMPGGCPVLGCNEELSRKATMESEILPLLITRPSVNLCFERILKTRLILLLVNTSLRLIFRPFCKVNQSGFTLCKSYSLRFYLNFILVFFLVARALQLNVAWNRI